MTKIDLDKQLAPLTGQIFSWYDKRCKITSTYNDGTCELDLIDDGHSIAFTMLSEVEAVGDD